MAKRTFEIVYTVSTTIELNDENLLEIAELVNIDVVEKITDAVAEEILEEYAQYAPDELIQEFFALDSGTFTIKQVDPL